MATRRSSISVGVPVVESVQKAYSRFEYLARPGECISVRSGCGKKEFSQVCQLGTNGGMEQEAGQLLSESRLLSAAEGPQGRGSKPRSEQYPIRSSQSDSVGPVDVCDTAFDPICAAAEDSRGKRPSVRIQLSNNGYATVCGHFHAEDTGAAYEAAFSELLSLSRRGSVVAFLEPSLDATVGEKPPHCK